MVIIFLLMAILIYAALNQNQNKEYNLMFYVLFAGLGLSTLICILRINKLMKEGRRDYTIAKTIKLESCPNFWVNGNLQSGDKMQRTCTNTADNKTFIGPVGDKNVKATVNIDSTLNTMTNSAKCTEAKKYAWSEASAKCAY